MNVHDNIRMFAFDRIITEKDENSISNVHIGSILGGTEAFGDLPENGNPEPKQFSDDRMNFTSMQYMLKGLTKEMAHELLHGSSFLEFYILALVHDKPTLNNRMYPLEPWIDALNEAGIIRQANWGGIGGNHCLII